MSDISIRTKKQFQMLADGLKDNPDYMAWVLASYQKIERISPSKLMHIFGISPMEFSKMALCKRPLAESADFIQQVTQIADYSNTDPTLLANIIRQVDSVQALLSKPEALTQREKDFSATQLRTGLLAAARDRSIQEPSQDSEPTTPTDEEEMSGGNGLVD